MCSKSEFRVLVYLHNFFSDYRALSRIFIDENMKYISDLQDYISQNFEITEPFYLASDYHYLPPTEDVRVLEKDESVIVMKIPPNQQHKHDSNKKPIKRNRLYVPSIKEQQKDDISKRKKIKRKPKALVAEDNSESFLQNLPEEIVSLYNDKAYTKGEKKKNKEQNNDVICDTQESVVDEKETTENVNTITVGDMAPEEKIATLLDNTPMEVTEIAPENLDSYKEEEKTKKETTENVNTITVGDTTPEEEISTLLDNTPMEVTEIAPENLDSYKEEEKTKIAIIDNILLSVPCLKSNNQSVTSHDPQEATIKTHQEQQQNVHNDNISDDDSADESTCKGVETSSVNIRKPFAVSDVLHALNSTNESESTAENNGCETEKRKRVRKRKKKTNTESVSENSYNSNQSYNVEKSNNLNIKGKPSIHIRFDSEDELETSTQNSTTSNNEIALDKQKTEDKSLKLVNKPVQNVNETLNISSLEFTNTPKRDDKTKSAKTIGVCNKSKEFDTTLDAPLTDNMIRQFPPAKAIPEQYDIISFKILKMNDDYSPTISEYITAKILNYDEAKGVVFCEIMYGQDELKEPIGKFSLNDEALDEEPCITKHFKWSELKDIKLLFSTIKQKKKKNVKKKVHNPLLP